MELTNDFRVPLPIEDAWAVLIDLERIAPCLPGAQLQEVEGEEYRGIVKVKVGPVTAQYKGAARFVMQDEVERVAVVRAEGRETRGQGTASATITACLAPVGVGETAVTVTTDLTITGRVAQFGRGVLADVSARLLGQFVDALSQTIAGDGTAPGPKQSAAHAAADPDEATASVPPPAAAVEASVRQAVASRTADVAPRPGPRRIDAPEPKAIDLVGTAGGPIAERVVPILALVLVIWLLRRTFGRGRG